MSPVDSSVPLWSIAREVRRVVEPRALGEQVIHYSIPSVDATGGGLVEDSSTIQSAKFHLFGDELLVSKLNPRKTRVVEVQSHELPAVGSTEFVSLVPWGCDRRFLGYLLKSETTRQELDSRVQSVTRSHQRVSPEEVLRLSVKLPPRDDQRRITDFLDAEVARIDALVAAKKRASDLIDERRVALTSKLCLRGVREYPAVKDSEIGPLGTVPSHWSVVRNKNLIREVSDLSVDGFEELLTVSHLTGVTPRSEKNVYMFMAESMAGYKKCQSGDLVINTLWAWMGALGFSKYDGIVSPAYGVYRFTSDGLLSDYFDLLYRTPEYVCEMTRYSKGVWSSRLRLYPESFLALGVPVPPLDEQKEIVRTLEEELEPERRLQEKIRQSNSLLLERRQALITAAVTGQIDVTTARGADVS
ncbi:restriction endonuclease subunit S [Nocardiopsis listeri]|uniref:restriction endonuclease subunit S n=1 Tax=Nocardiopsis listeri TaxID=53440 RepID=UPI000AC0851C|nr:restriction endonuclease subunit S [Nocardiopsis listeri]